MGSAFLACIAVVIIAYALALILSETGVVERAGRKLAVVCNDDKTFYCSESGLAGKPDRTFYDVKTGRYTVEEIKKRHYHGRVYESELMQLMAYLYLVEKKQKEDVVGYILYGNGVRKGPFKLDDYYRKKLSLIVNEIREIRRGKIPAGTLNKAKCAGCSVREECRKLGAAGWENWMRR